MNWKGFVGSCKVNKFFEKKEKKLFLTLGPVARELAVATVVEVCFGEFSRVYKRVHILDGPSQLVYIN